MCRCTESRHSSRIPTAIGRNDRGRGSRRRSLGKHQARQAHAQVQEAIVDLMSFPTQTTFFERLIDFLYEKGLSHAGRR
jgi:hypothetical protein